MVLVLSGGGIRGTLLYVVLFSSDKRETSLPLQSRFWSTAQSNVIWKPMVLGIVLANTQET